MLRQIRVRSHAALPIPTSHSATARVLEALLSEGIGRDDVPLETEAESIMANFDAEVADAPLPEALPPDVLDDSLPSLASAQRADPIWGEVLTYLDMAQEERHVSWLKRPFPADSDSPTDKWWPTMSAHPIRCAMLHMQFA